MSSALVILGLQAVKTLALGFSLLTNLKKNSDGSADGFDQTAFWKYSIYAATASRVIARKTSVIQQEEAFLAGLLANVGVLVLHRVMPEQFDVLYAQSKGDHGALHRLCREKMGVDPAETSALLADKWQLPPLLTAPIAKQHSRDEVDATLKPLVEAVSAGVLVAGVFVAEDSASAIGESRKELAARFDFSAEQIEEPLMDEIGSTAREAATMLDVQIGRERSYQEILDEAQQAIIDLSLESQKQVQTFPSGKWRRCR